MDFDNRLYRVNGALNTSGITTAEPTFDDTSRR